MNEKHTFAICAYKESPYLEECILSVKKQTITSQIILTTSTPCTYIEKLCHKYEIPYFINTGESGITQDWNFAYSKASTPIVTITHQDDIYYETYAEQVIAFAEKSNDSLIFFSDYHEIRNGEISKSNTLLNIKRIMLFPLRFKLFQSNILLRRQILAFGSPICCPSVAFFKNNLPEIVFLNHFRTNEDWEAWERISKMKGQFLYCKRPLMAHRIHKDSETTATIKETGRSNEDIEMFRKFWPEFIVKILVKFYKKSETYNET